MMEPISIDDLADATNIGECECGNHTHLDYLAYDNNGASSCPICQAEYLTDIILKLTALVKEIADPSLSAEEVNKMIAAKYCEVHGISTNGSDGLNLNMN